MVHRRRSSHSYQVPPRAIYPRPFLLLLLTDTQHQRLRKPRLLGPLHFTGRSKAASRVREAI
jgi:hypothetical protein